MEIICDAQPLISFAKVLERFLEFRKGTLCLGDLGFEVARVDSDVGSTGTGEVVVRLYPSDALFRFAGAVLAGDFDFCGVEESRHGCHSPNV
jgi:hypothetical protein